MLVLKRCQIRNVGPTFTVTAVCLFCTPASWGVSYLVKPDGTGDFPTIRAALSAVVDGDTIELSDGVFTGPDNRGLDGLGLAITMRSQNGDPAQCVIDCQRLARAIRFESHEGHAFLLEGITIANGTSQTGGGIRCVGYSSPTIANCMFKGNAASMDGGGLYCLSSSPLLQDCLFLGNSAVQEGGGIASSGRPPVTLRNCTFVENTATNGGGLYSEGSLNNTTLLNCSFYRNEGSSSGGGMRSSGNSPVLTACVFEENTASSGGGTSCTDGNPEYTNCEFIRNSAGSQGGAASCAYFHMAAFSGCVFWGNSAPAGAGLRSNEGHPALHGCTFYGNDGSAGAGGIYLHSGASCVLDNTIISSSTSGEAIAVEAGSDITLSCCDIYGNAGGDWTGYIGPQFATNGNISADPLFCEVAAGDFGLQEGSPCTPFTPPNPECDLIGARPVSCPAASVEIRDGVHGTGRLWSPVPNPASQRISVAYDFPITGRPGKVPLEVRITDASGRVIQQWLQVPSERGCGRIEWDCRDGCGKKVPCGLYYIAIGSGEHRLVRSVTIVR
jgi:predicted outer membrane repeat protein